MWKAFFVTVYSLTA